ncbi:hypothetical protein SFRURICE_006280 [Spodoptera frugiperda]|nr:hypothetical protein SFRURICE_006280 [Spodoptera frugiperda]
MGRPTKSAAFMKKKRLNETIIEKEDRLRKNSERNSEKRSQESSDERENRLSLMRSNTKRKLRRENSDQRVHRLSLIHDRLSNETEDERARRLSLIHDRLSNEIEDERAHRLSLIHDRLSNETEEQRTHRLSQIQNHLSNETLDSRIVRLNTMRNHNRRDVYGELDFQAAINANADFADVPCGICKKLLYPQQRCILQTTKYSSIMPEQLVVMEQLPLAPNEAGLVLVVESLENIQRSKEFVVDMNKLHRALTWLMSNNILYRDVTPHFKNLLKLDTTKDLLPKWRLFKQQFKIFVSASGLKRVSDTRKAAILLNCAGHEVQELYFNVLKTEETIKYEQLLKSLDEYFEPKQNENELISTFAFHKRCQEKGQNFDLFYTDLRKLVKQSLGAVAKPYQEDMSTARYSRSGSCADFPTPGYSRQI